MLQVVQALKTQNPKFDMDILKPENFWHFHFTSTDYLDKYAEKNQFERNKYPWTYRNIRWGDLERGYVKPLTNENVEFCKIIEGNENFKISKIELQYQFQRFIYSQDWLKNFDLEIKDFIEDRKNPVHNIKMIMMGITNHWYLFMAHRF